jgi:hypothetical protein
MKKSLAPESHESVCRQWGDCKIVTKALGKGLCRVRVAITNMVISLDIVTLFG